MYFVFCWFLFSVITVTLVYIIVGETCYFCYFYSLKVESLVVFMVRIVIMEVNIDLIENSAVH